MNYRCVIEDGGTKVLACGYATDQPGQEAGDDYHGVGAWSAYTHETLPDVPEGMVLHEVDGDFVIEPEEESE